jgi:uncharacterized protein (TIGR02611 family)
MTRRAGDDRGFLQRNAKRIVVGVIGTAVIIAGLFMLVLPGPGILTVVAGLAILASEFDWAERWMHRLRDRAEAAAKKSGVSLRAVVAVGIFFTVAIGVAAWLLFR